jgi:glycosyltransferase involved in cell wall biosynthesis
MKGFPVDDAVTAVVPANAEATLDETLRSVRAQTHREILVVDDGSRDGTPA